MQTIKAIDYRQHRIWQIRQRLCYCNESREGIFTVNKGIEKLSGDSFRGCSLLTKISLPWQFTGNWAMRFYGMRRTDGNSNSPDGVTTWKTNTFFGCSKLSKITLPSTLEQDWQWMFRKYIAHRNSFAHFTCMQFDQSIWRMFQAGTYICRFQQQDIQRHRWRIGLDKEGKTRISYPGGKKRDLPSTHGIIHIKDFAFEFCRKLSNLIVDGDNQHWQESLQSLLWTLG